MVWQHTVTPDGTDPVRHARRGVSNEPGTSRPAPADPSLENWSVETRIGLVVIGRDGPAFADEPPFAPVVPASPIRRPGRLSGV